MSKLPEKDVCAIGTMRENGTGGTKQKLMASKELQKNQRSGFDYCTDDKVFVAKLHDHSVVTTASNWATYTPL